MDTIPTYYIDLIKQQKEEFNRLQARWNQIYTQRRYAIKAGKVERSDELYSQMMVITKRQTVIHEKLEQWESKR